MSEEKTLEVKPLNCPFCGREGEIIDRHHRDGTVFWLIDCHCGVFTEGHEDKERAVNIWNRRSGCANQKEVIEIIEDLLHDCMSEDDEGHSLAVDRASNFLKKLKASKRSSINNQPLIKEMR